MFPYVPFLSLVAGAKLFLNKMSTRCHKSFELEVWLLHLDTSGHQWPPVAVGRLARQEKPDTEPYLAAHHIILSHARAVT